MVGLKVKYGSGYRKGEVYTVLSEPFYEYLTPHLMVVIERSGKFVTERLTKLEPLDQNINTNHQTLVN